PRPPGSTLSPYRRSSDLGQREPIVGTADDALDGRKGQPTLAGCVRRKRQVANPVPYQWHRAVDQTRQYQIAGTACRHSLVVQYLDRKSTRLNSSHVKISY